MKVPLLQASSALAAMCHAMLRSNETIEAAASRISKRHHFAAIPGWLRENGQHFRELRAELAQERTHGK